MKTAACPIRFAWAAAFALLLSLRLIGAAGYMPAVDHGRLTIVACPDAEASAPLAIGGGHHHHGAKHNHGTCPYAEASALGALAPDLTPLIAVLVFAIPLLGRTLIFAELQRTRERPPAIGPPIRA
jgi:hypothetical protein